MTSTETLPTIGAVLRNGAMVLAARVNERDDVVVLCLLGAEDRWEGGNFATWYYRPDNGLCFEGGYFATIEGALHDYETTRH